MVNVPKTHVPHRDILTRSEVNTLFKQCMTMLQVLNKINALPVDKEGQLTQHDQLKKIIITEDKKYKSNRLASSAFMAYVLDNIKEQAGAELNNVLDALNIAFPKIYKEANTRNKYMSMIRQEIAAKYGQDSEEYRQSNDRMKITKKEKAAIKTNYNLGLKDKGRNRQVFEQEGVLQLIHEALNKDHYADQAIGLMLTSGARPFEIMYKNEYEPAETEGWIRVTHLAKKRGDKAGDVAVRPLIKMSAPEFISRVDKMRELAKKSAKRILNAKKTELSKSVYNTLNDHLRAYEGYEEEAVGVLRKIYGNLSHELYADKVTYNLNTWLSDVLGHNRDDIATAAAYAVVAVNPQGPERETREVLTKLAEVKADNQTIKQDIDELKREVRETERELEAAVAAHAVQAAQTVEKIPKKLGRTEAQIKQLLREKLIEMKNKGLKLTNESVRKNSGLGAVYVNKYLKELKDEVLAA